MVLPSAEHIFLCLLSLGYFKCALKTQSHRDSILTYSIQSYILQSQIMKTCIDHYSAKFLTVITLKIS